MEIIIPDFARLSDADAERETSRQERLRRDFNSRIRLSPAEIEAGRAQILTENLAQAVETAPDTVEGDRLRSQLAEQYAAQGYFLKAAETEPNPEEQEFYTKVAEAVNREPNTRCECAEESRTVGKARIRLPKYRVIKEINSLPAGAFGFLVECNSCGEWFFTTNNPLPKAIDPKDFDPGTTPNDLDTLKA